MPKRIGLRALTTDEKAEIQRLAASRKEPIRLVQRARIIAAMDEILNSRQRRPGSERGSRAMPWGHFAWLIGMAHVSIYRDLGDVGVSQTLHIMDDSQQFLHPGKGTYQLLGGFDEILTAVIEGLGPFTGLIERWEMHAPWLNEEWVHKVRFEDGIANPAQCAFNIIDYGVNRTVKVVGESVGLSKVKMQELAEKMALSSQQTMSSPTFREGKVGSWKNHFTEEHEKLFNEKAGDWLIEFGYEKNDKW